MIINDVIDAIADVIRKHDNLIIRENTEEGLLFELCEKRIEYEERHEEQDGGGTCKSQGMQKRKNITFHRIVAVYAPHNDDLFEVATKNKDSFFRMKAVKKLSDEAMLAKIAQTESDPYVREIAIEKLTDEAVLSKIE